VVNAMKDRGFLLGNAGALGNMVKLRPPLVFGRVEADAFLSAFEDAVHALYGGL
jgi:4-aminobutyrate aminotransferase-like enzyme